MNRFTLPFFFSLLSFLLFMIHENTIYLVYMLFVEIYYYVKFISFYIVLYTYNSQLDKYTDGYLVALIF